MTGRLTDEQQRLVEQYMPYVRALVARNWQQSDAELQADLVQQGYLALVDAALRYDPIGHPTTTFIGYAKWRVRKYIGEYVQLDRQIRPPWHMIKSNTKPERRADVPLQTNDENADILGKYPDDTDEYEDIDEALWMDWFSHVWHELPIRMRTLYMQWMQGTLDWDRVTELEQEQLYQLDARLHS